MNELTTGERIALAKLGAEFGKCVRALCGEDDREAILQELERISYEICTVDLKLRLGCL